MPVNYQKSRIYKIVCDDSESVWVGATTKTLCQRMAQHRDTYKQNMKGKARWCSSFLVMNGKNARIELIEAYPCNDKDELNKRLYELIKQTPNAINNKKPDQEETKTEPINEVVEQAEP